MLRLDALNAKQDALDLGVKRRESILRELFRATLAFRRIKSKDAANQSEDSFFDKNNILEGRAFDPVTLPSLPGSPTGDFKKSQPLDLQFNESVHLEDEEKAPPPTERPPLNQGFNIVDSRGALEDPASAVDITPDLQMPASYIESGNRHVKSSADGASHAKGSNVDQRDPSAVLDRTSTSDGPTCPENVVGIGADLLFTRSQIDEGHGINPSVAVPISSDDVGDLPQSVSEEITAEQIPGGARIAHLPTKEVQEHGSHDGDEEITVSGSSSPRQSREDQVVEATKSVTENQIVDRKASSAPERHSVGAESTDQTRPGSLLRSQMESVRADTAFAGAPATPDEQLRLEEAQALQLSTLPSAVLEEDGAHIQEPPAAQDIGAPGLLSQNDEDQSVDALSPSIGINRQDPVIDDRHKPSQTVEPPTPGLRENIFPGMAGGLAKDLTFSRRPPMRIDTDVAPAIDSLRFMPNRKAATPGTTPFTPSEPATGTKSGSTTSQVRSPPERMTTRVSSGALRHKSVSEILGETPRHATLQSEKGPADKGVHDSQRDEVALQTPKSATSIASPDTVAFKQRLSELKEKERSKLSTVVFAPQQHLNLQRNGDPDQLQQNGGGERHAEAKDYLLPLFTAQAAVPVASQALHSLVVSAHKTLATADHYIDSQEQQDCRILTRIYQLQSANRWSLRQTERSVEPSRPKAHWDVLLSQMRWMQTDFREERKWKLAAAKRIADACAQWVESSLEERTFLQVKRRPTCLRQESHSIAETPDLIPSAEDDSDLTDFEATDLEMTKRGAPASIFSLPPDMFVFGLDKTPVAEKILSELPLYQPSAHVQDVVLSHTQEIPDDEWKTPIVPLSRFVEGKMVMREEGPPRKRSRYDYSSDQEIMHHLTSHYSQEMDQDTGGLGPEKDDVALFRAENKHIRDRIHAGHAFRPPSEYLMPSQSFFKSRQSSQWTQAEDDELRRLVREYAYNWSLISSCLLSPSLFSSGAERRTPWECFERWISLEGLPAEMSKTQYFKEYHSRLQAAQSSHEAQLQALQQHQGNNGQTPLRRRTTLPILVERRRSNRHLHLVDAMRKLAKKRETALHKQQHVAGLAAMRKQNEAVQPRAAMHTPQEFSRVKYEREQKVQENARIYQQQMMAQREKAKNQRPGGPGGGQNMMPRGPNYPPAANGSSPNVAPAMPNGHGQAGSIGQMRPGPPVARLPNGTQVPSSLPTTAQGVPHAPMQPQMQVQQRLPAQMMTDNARIFQEATRLQEQQRRYLAAQTQHQHPQSNGNSTSPPTMSHLNALNQNNAALQSNTAIYGGLQGRSGSPSVNGTPVPSGASSSPRMTNPSQPQPLSSGMVPVVNQVQNQIKARHPQASPEQVKAMTTESLHQYRMNQAAMQAAAGNPNATGMVNHSSLNGLPSQPQQGMMNGINGSPMLGNARAQYAAMVHNHQAQQSRGSGGGISAPRPASRSATPQTHPGHAPSQSPRPAQAQMATGQ